MVNRSLPLLLVPIELKSRELKARLYLGARALDLGFPVIIGPSTTLHRKVEKFPRGVVIENDSSPATLKFVKRAHRLGFHFVGWDEEAISVINDKWYVRHRVDPKSLSLFDIFFTRGLGDKKAIGEAYQTESNKLVAAGNPRLDILHHTILPLPDYKPNGPILVMSRFSRSNPFSITREEVINKVQRKFNLNEMDMEFYAGFLEHCHQVFDSFYLMVGNLAQRFSDRDILIRPHPSENFGKWEALSELHCNLTVETSRTAEEWAADSSLIVHNGCTTGLEAALIGRPVLSYMPHVSERFDVPLPNLVSDCHHSEESLFSSIQDILNTPPDVSRISEGTWQTISEQWVGNGTDALSTNTILSTLLETYHKGLRPKPSRTTALIKEKMRKKLRRVKKVFVSDDVRASSLSEQYRNQKFPPTTTGELQDLLEKLGFSHVLAKPTRNNWWKLELHP